MQLLTTGIFVPCVRLYFHFHRAFAGGGKVSPQTYCIYFYYSLCRATDLSGIPLLRRGENGDGT